MRRYVIWTATFIGGLYFFLEFMLGGTNTFGFLSDAKEDILIVLAVIGSFGIGLGLVSIASVHGRRIAMRKKGWVNSLALIVSLIVTVIVGLAAHYSRSSGAPAGSGEERGVAYVLFQKVIFESMLSPLGASMFALLAFYMVSASYRAFRVRSLEAGVMMVSAVIVMLAQVPLGAAVSDFLRQYVSTSIPSLPSVKEWLLGVPNAAAQRGIFFGSQIAGFAFSIRLWLGLERGTYFDRNR